MVGIGDYDRAFAPSLSSLGSCELGEDFFICPERIFFIVFFGIISCQIGNGGMHGNEYLCIVFNQQNQTLCKLPINYEKTLLSA